MSTISQLFISTAYAQDVQVATPPMAGFDTSLLWNAWPLIMVMVVFYVLMVRPQQKKMDEQVRMLKALQRGDQVVTTSGIFGKIAKIEGDEAVILEIADGVQVKVVKHFISGLALKPTPVAANDADKAGKK